jgi:hypothetical protein
LGRRRALCVALKHRLGAKNQDVPFFATRVPALSHKDGVVSSYETGRSSLPGAHF